MMNSFVRGTPRILLAGPGRFGRQHLATWRTLEQEGLARIQGILIRTPPSEDPGYPMFTDIAALDLTQFDAVDIVTPAASHPALVRHFLPHLHVLVEKPLALSAEESLELEALAKGSERLLMVNHLYRFHPAVHRMREIVRSFPDEAPVMISVTFTNPYDDEVAMRPANLEFLHVFDIPDEILSASEPTVLTCQRQGHLWRASLIYANGSKVNVEFGWGGDERVRTVDIRYAGKRYQADLRDTSVLASTRETFTRIPTEGSTGTLDTALRAFVRAIQGEDVAFPDASIGRRIVETAVASAPRPVVRRPRVAIIGAGIFGASCAFELAPTCDVTLIERHDQILTEATFNNQWRHHSGFHYPRSLETIKEIQETRDDFRAMYGNEVILDIPSYYCTSVSAKEITRDRYLEACRAGGLDFTIAEPPEGVLDHTQLDLCLRTDEGVFDFPLLRQVVEERLRTTSEIQLMLNAEATGAVLESSGQKLLTIRTEEGERQAAFDYVVNATYANKNLLASWLGFPIEPLRFDLCEILVLELDLPPVAVTILDGPFTSLVGTGKPREFMLSHIHESILASEVTANGLPPQWAQWRSNREHLIRQCSRYLPVVKEAKIMDSRFATRAVRAFSEDYDGRPTVVRSYGFGCWSVLGGKIVTSVSTAKALGTGIAFYVESPR